MKKIVFLCVLFCVPAVAFADASIRLDVESPSGTLYNNSITVTPCPVTDDPATTTVSAKCALEQAGLSPQWSNYGGDDWFLTSAGGASQDFANNLYWGWWSDLSYGQIALNKHELHDGEKMLVALGVFPLRVNTPTSATVGTSSTVTVDEFGFDAGYNGVWNPSVNASVDIGGTLLQTDSAGAINFIASSTDPVTVSATKTGFVSASATFSPSAATTTATTTADATPPVTAGGGSGTTVTHAQMNVANALSYLSSKQNADGSYQDARLTDWASIAFAAADPGQARTKLHAYLLTANPTCASVLDCERHAMALEASGIDPYTGSASDYISPIVKAFDGTQIGDPALDNDDIFALFPLLHAGYSNSDAMVQKISAFIVSKQSAAGSWDGSVDITAAAVQALAPVQSLPGVSSALSSAKTYLRAQQQTNAGFGNGFSTSWALQAIAALNDSPSSWTQSGYYPTDFLFGLQQNDGAFESADTDTSTRVWATEYAISGGLGTTWNAVLGSFSKPVATAGGSSSTATSTTAISPSATSTALVATSSPAIATTTIATSSTPTASSTVPVFEVAATSTHPAATSTKLVTPHKLMKMIRPVTIVASSTSATSTRLSSSTPQTPSVQSQTASASNASPFDHIRGFFKWLFGKHW